MGQLAKILTKYYFRNGKRVVFVNKMSMNRLAMEMWNAQGGKSIEPSVLSRVISGERLFTAEQSRAFCETLDLTKKQRKEIQNAIINDWHQRLGFASV